jgi:hypothetical protein
MTDWLYTLSDWVLLLGAATLLAGATFVLPSLVRHLPHLAPGAENSEFALRMQPTLFTATALVLVFTLVGVEANFRKAEAVVATEASHINRLDRLLARYEDPSALQIRTRLRVYTGRSDWKRFNCLRKPLAAHSSKSARNRWFTLKML